jgi:prophage maintenance system killer protein
MTIRNGESQGEILLYKAPDGTTSLDVKLERETVWLSQVQMGELFAKDRRTISEHIGNVFKEKELSKKRTVRKFRIVQKEGGRSVERAVDFYSLDVIISVGYRVKSKRGTQFRIWATRVLREHLLKGYTANERRLRDLNQAVRLIAGVADRRDLSGDEAKALLQVVGEYRFALDLLDDYDYQRVAVPPVGRNAVRTLSYAEALRIVERLRERFGGSALFGRQKDEGLQSALGAVMQTFEGRDLYPSLEEKAAHLLYFLIKNHAFVDGNKRIGAALFLWFLEKNGAIRDKKGERRISDAALVAVALLIAESRPEERETIVRIVTHLLCERAEGSPA